VVKVFVPLVLALAIAAAACGGAAGPSNNPSLDQLPTIQYVGNSSCPTSGTTNYFAGSKGAIKPAGVNSLPPVGQAIDEMPHTHVQPPAQITYNHNPPTSGCHYNLGYGDAPIQTGAYNQVIPPEYWVHNLEHGYVVALYNCPSGCATEFQDLRNWYHSLPDEPGFPYPKVIIIPWPTMDVPFAAVSWDWYDPIPNFSIAEFNRFYMNHRFQAAEPTGP
jgi:Protein of unknown function (DUF3105)